MWLHPPINSRKNAAASDFPTGDDQLSKVASQWGSVRVETGLKAMSRRAISSRGKNPISVSQRLCNFTFD